MIADTRSAPTDEPALTLPEAEFRLLCRRCIWNTILGRPRARILVTPSDGRDRDDDWLESLRSETLVWAAESAFDSRPEGHYDFAVIRSATAGPVRARWAIRQAGNSHRTIPGLVVNVVGDRIDRARKEKPGYVLVVPGTATTRGDRHRLRPAAYARLHAAEELASTRRPLFVVLSGYAGDTDGPSEAELLADRWALPGVPLVLDVAARTTAENALCALSIITAVDAVGEVMSIASWSNALRQATVFRAAAPRSLRVRTHIEWGAQHAESLRPGLTGLALAGRHLRAGRAYLRGGADGPGAWLPTPGRRRR